MVTIPIEQQLASARLFPHRNGGFIEPAASHPLMPFALLPYPYGFTRLCRNHLAALDQRLSEGDRLLAAGKPVEAIRTWRSIWDLDAVDAEGLGKQLSTVYKSVEAYES